MVHHIIALIYVKLQMMYQRPIGNKLFVITKVKVA